MSDLPGQKTTIPSAGAFQQDQNQSGKTVPDPQQPRVTGTSAGSRETEGGIQFSAETPRGLTEVGKDVPLPKEVLSAGVGLHPTTVALPTALTNYGVTPVGHNVTLGTGATVQLPLTDDQIIQGLKQSVSSSWRWMAEWCVRRLKMIHDKLKKKEMHT